MKKLKWGLAVLVAVLLFSAAFSVYADTRSSAFSRNVFISVYNLTTGATVSESLKAGTFYLYTTCTYGGPSNLYPLAVGSNGLYFNTSYPSSGSVTYGPPSVTTSVITWEIVNNISYPTHNLLNYQQDVGILSANYASKQSDSTPVSSYNFGPKNAKTTNMNLNLNVRWYKK
ncbi:MAG: hypothetical protein GX781_02205 [Clostridiales bacterium]|nr:hypothetical protein [Clostridiales bacterium]